MTRKKNKQTTVKEWKKFHPHYSSFLRSYFVSIKMIRNRKKSRSYLFSPNITLIFSPFFRCCDDIDASLHVGECVRPSSERTKDVRFSFRFADLFIFKRIHSVGKQTLSSIFRPLDTDEEHLSLFIEDVINHPPSHR